MAKVGQALVDSIEVFRRDINRNDDVSVQVSSIKGIDELKQTPLNY